MIYKSIQAIYKAHRQIAGKLESNALDLTVSYCKSIWDMSISVRMFIMTSLFIVSLSGRAKAQDTSADIIGVTAGFGTAGTTLVDWSIGSIVSDTYILPSGQLVSQGYLQPYYLIGRTFVFNPFAARIYGDAPFAAGATVSTGEQITYLTSDGTVATLASDIITIAGAGSSIITAIVPASGSEPELRLSQTLQINRATQTINFDMIADMIRGGAASPLNYSATSGLPVSLLNTDTMVVRLGTNTVSPLRIGSSIIVASQPGDRNYLPAENVIRKATVIGANPDENVLIGKVISDNGDGRNDYLYIEMSDDQKLYNKLTIVDRHGSVLKKISNYDNSNRVFKPFSERINGLTLPGGTYFYMFEYLQDGKTKVKKGFFVVVY